jgi:cadmium resistance protein CadD (predicted permease)
MLPFFQDCFTAIAAFIATNLDDVLILILFFSQVNATFRRRHIFMGQYVGFILLLLLCLPAYFGGQVIPQSWIKLLGLLPIAIGLKALRSEAQDSQPDSLQTPSNLDQTLRQLPAPLALLSSLLAPQTYRVAAVTIANGGDNIGIYVPLFASRTPPQLITMLTIFLGAIALLCTMALHLTQQPRVAKLLVNYGDRLVPFLLIALGLFILI